MILAEKYKKAFCVFMALFILTLALPGRSLAADDTDNQDGGTIEDVTGIDEDKLTDIESQLQKLGEKVADMSDEELEQEVRSLLDRANLDLSDKQVEKIVGIVRSAGEDAENITDKVESVSKTAEKLQRIKDAVAGFFTLIWEFLKTVWFYIWSFIQKYI